MVAFQSDAESNSGLMIDEPAEGTPRPSAGTGIPMQEVSADTSPTPLVTDVQAPMEVEQE